VTESTAGGGARVFVSGLMKTFHLAPGSALTAVNDVTLDVSSGSVVALTGPSGSGKSTLLHLIGAIERSDGGILQVDGRDITSLSRGALADYRRGVGFVFQRYHLLPALTALDNVLAPVLPYRTTYDKVGRGRELLAAVGLEGRESGLPSRLSGGQQQRVAIARALINEPRLMLADEPTGNLDTRTGEDILALLLDLRRVRGTTILIATHDARIAALCDKVVRLRDGRVIESLEVPPSLPGEEVLQRITALDAR
jgi:putative ABC transport system ATP-binding protein